MELFWRIFVGLLIVGAGFVVVWKANWFVNNFGYMAWAERVLGIFGGTRTIIKLIGIVAIFLGFLYITGQSDEFLNFLFGWIVPG